MQVPTLETQRLLLRPWRAEDVRAYARIIRHPEALRYWGAGLSYRLKRAAAALVATVSDIEARRAVAELQRHWQRHGFGTWAVEEKHGGELVGGVGLTQLEGWTADPASIEVGWLLARSERTAQRLGMAFGGRTHWRGIDVVWYAMDRDG